MTLARNPAIFVHPVAGWEDATQGINVYADPAAPLLHAYAGYVSVLPNLVGWVSLHWLRLEWVPFALAWFALSVSACLPGALYGFFRNAAGLPIRPALIGALLVSTVPIGDAALCSNTEFSIWAMLAALLLTLFNPLSDRPWPAAASLIWRALAVCSTPLSLLAAPVWAWLAYRSRGGWRAWAYVALLAVLACYFVAGVAHDGPVLASTWAAASVRLAIEKPLDGLVLRGMLRLNPPDLPMAALIGLGSVAGWLVTGVQAGKRRRWAVLFLLAMALGVGLLCAFGRGAEKGAAFLLASPRYQYVPKLFWLAALAMAAEALWRRSAHKAAANVALAVLFGLLYGKGIKAYRHQDLAQSRAVFAFLAEAQARRDAGHGTAGRLARIDSQGDWSIVIPGSQ